MIRSATSARLKVEASQEELCLGETTVEACSEIGVRAMMPDGMMWGMGLGHLLLAVLVLLSVAALMKYLFFR